MRCAPATLARPTSITFEAWTFSPTLRPAGKPVRRGGARPGQTAPPRLPPRLGAGGEDGRGGERPDRPDGPHAASAAAVTDPGHAGEQVEERRVGERHRREDLALVEEPEGDGEREQDEEVEVPDGDGAAKGGKPEQECAAEDEPDCRVVDLAAERALAAPRHRPRHLRPRPGLGYARRVVLHLREDDLARLALGPDLDRPEIGLLVAGRVLDETLRP